MSSPPPKLNSGQPTIGQGFEFQVIVAAVLGGVSLAGGRGTVLGTTAGAAIVVVIGVALNINNINTFWQQTILGFLLVTVVALDVIFKVDRRFPSWLRVGRRDRPPQDGQSPVASSDQG